MCFKCYELLHNDLLEFKYENYFYISIVGTEKNTNKGIISIYSVFYKKQKQNQSLFSSSSLPSSPKRADEVKIKFVLQTLYDDALTSIIKLNLQNTDNENIFAIASNKVVYIVKFEMNK